LGIFFLGIGRLLWTHPIPFRSEPTDRSYLTRFGCRYWEGGVSGKPLEKNQANRAVHPRSVTRFVRKGLEGREAVAQSIKSMQSMGFYALRDGTPAKPGFLRYSAKNAPK
jgi:hypothetical protein